MTNTEELNYLIGLVMSASEWRISEGDERDPLRIEIQQRIDNLTGKDETIVDGRIQSTEFPTKKSKVKGFNQWCYHNRKRLEGKEDWEKRNIYNHEILGEVISNE